MPILGFLRENARWLTAGMLLTFLSSFGQTFFISLFAGHIQKEFDLSHGQWGGIYTLGTGLSALIMVWAGGLVDHYRVRTIAPIILILLTFSCMAMAINHNWLVMVLVIFALRFTGQGMASHIATVAMSRWFVATRGKALSIATLGFAIGEAILPLAFVALMVSYDWRLLWIVAAVISLSGILPLTRLLKQERTPQAIATESHNVGMQNHHWTRNQTVRHFLFWFMVPALLGPSAFNTAFFFHQVHFADLKNMEHVTLVAMYPFYTLIGIFAMMGSGWALDRYGTSRLIPWMQVPMIVAFLLFGLAQSNIILMFGFVFLALTTGFNTTLPNAFWAEFYGTKNLGSIKAMAAAIMVLGSAIGPGLTGLGIDLGLGLESQYYLIAIYFLFTTIMMWIGIQRAQQHR